MKAVTHEEKALDYYLNRDFQCAQAVLAAFAPECGLTEAQALKLGTCFGSGMRKGEVCGACTGALMVLGLLFGQDAPGDAESRRRANSVNDEMLEKFAGISGSYLCRELLGYDISTKEGAECARSSGLFTGFCPKMVANAVSVLEEIIEEQKKTAL